MAAGHGLTEIRGYTLTQVTTFIKAISRARARERVGLVADMRAAVASKRDRENYVKELTRGGR